MKGKEDSETLQKFDTIVLQQNFKQTGCLLHGKAEKHWYREISVLISQIKKKPNKIQIFLLWPGNEDQLSVDCSSSLSSQLSESCQLAAGYHTLLVVFPDPKASGVGHVKPWPTPPVSTEQEVLYLCEPNPLGFFKNPRCRSGKFALRSSLESAQC